MKPPPDPLPPASAEHDFSIRAATLNDLAWISELQQSTYSVADAVPMGKLREWFQVNPEGFFILENDSHDRAGHVTFLPLKADCLGQYCREGGEGMIETEIRGTDLHPPEEKDSTADLYLESIILPKQGRRAAMRSLLKALPGMISGLCQNQGEGRIFALAATPAGAGWLEKMGFVPISRAAARRDGHEMYRAARSDFLERAAAGLETN